MKVAYISEDYARKLADFLILLQREGREFLTDSKSVSAQKSKSSINLTIETLLGTKNMIRRGCYSSNNFQDTNIKQKLHK